MAKVTTPNEYTRNKNLEYVFTFPRVEIAQDTGVENQDLEDRDSGQQLWRPRDLLVSRYLGR